MSVPQPEDEIVSGSLRVRPINNAFVNEAVHPGTDGTIFSAGSAIGGIRVSHARHGAEHHVSSGVVFQHPSLVAPEVLSYIAHKEHDEAAGFERTHNAAVCGQLMQYAGGRYDYNMETTYSDGKIRALTLLSNKVRTSSAISAGYHAVSSTAFLSGLRHVIAVHGMPHTYVFFGANETYLVQQRKTVVAAWRMTFAAASPESTLGRNISLGRAKLVALQKTESGLVALFAWPGTGNTRTLVFAPVTLDMRVSGQCTLRQDTSVGEVVIPDLVLVPPTKLDDHQATAFEFIAGNNSVLVATCTNGRLTVWGGSFSADGSAKATKHVLTGDGIESKSLRCLMNRADPNTASPLAPACSARYGGKTHTITYVPDKHEFFRSSV